MRRFAFTITILGLFFLVLSLNQSPILISSQQELESLVENRRVQVHDTVISERSFGSSKILTLNNDIELICNCKHLLSKNISVIGTKQTYRSKTRIQVLRIESTTN